MLSDIVLSEIASHNCTNMEDLIETGNAFLNFFNVNEATYDKVTQHVRFEILDVDRFVKVNNCQCITNPRAFDRDGIPSSDGLLSNEIFGITADETSGTFAYIDLHGWFMDPSCYKTWIRIDSNIRNCVHGIGTYSIDKQGFIIEDDKGETGIGFLKKNIQKIQFRPSKSIKRDLSIAYLEKNRDKIFINKFIVIPKYYRDKNSSNSRAIGLGGINKLYTNLIVATNALEATQDFMFDASDAMNGRVQEAMLNIYDWFIGNNNPNISTDLGIGISGKFGVMNRANLAKTSNFASRLVISEAEIKFERVEDVMVNIDYSAIPLASILAEFRDFIMFQVRRFFDIEFVGKETYPILDKKGNVKYVEVEDPEINFSDDRIKLEMDRFVHGYNNRFVPVEIPVKGLKEKYYMYFKGIGVSPDMITRTPKGDIVNTENPESILNRRMTWCDIFYQAAVEATKNKHVLITRFPVDAYTNQIATKIIVSSTHQTEPVVYNGVYYPFYPKIRESDIGVDTSNWFVDTLQMSNNYLDGLCGDFDGNNTTIILVVAPYIRKSVS